MSWVATASLQPSPSMALSGSKGGARCSCVPLCAAALRYAVAESVTASHRYIRRYTSATARSRSPRTPQPGVFQTGTRCSATALQTEERKALQGHAPLGAPCNARFALSGRGGETDSRSGTRISTYGAWEWDVAVSREGY